MKKLLSVLFVVCLLVTAGTTCALGEESCAHANSSWQETQSPTCSTDGKLQRICSDCGAVLMEEYVDATGHDYGEDIASEPTCTEDGVERFTCYNCGDTYSVVIPSLGHNTVNGICTICGAGSCTHANTSWQETQSPTCSTDGKQQQICSDCGAVLAEDSVAAPGHDYGEDIVSQPTCTEDGVVRFTCYNCGDTYSDVIASPGHNTVNGICTVCGAGSCAHANSSWQETQSPTCSTDGKQQQICSDCGAVLAEESVDATGHDYGEDITSQPTCTEDGVLRFTCYNCGDSYVQVLPSPGHQYQKEVLKARTCTEEGKRRFTCSSCGHSYVDYPAPAGHKYTDGICTVCEKAAFYEAATLTFTEENIPEGAQLVLEECLNRRTFDAALENAISVYRTVMTLNGEEAELPCAVEVQLTCDEETTAMLTGTRLVMLMEDGTLTELPYVMEDGKLTFTLTAAGTYAFMPAAE